MIQMGKVKFDNNYWAKKSNGTWTNYYNFFDVIKHDFGVYNTVQVCNNSRVVLTSTDAGATFTEGELEPIQFPSNDLIYINIPDEDIHALVENKLNFNGQKVVTWEEEMHEVA